MLSVIAWIEIMNIHIYMKLNVLIKGNKSLLRIHINIHT